MIATASDIVWERGVTTVARRPSRWRWMRSATSKTCGMSWLLRITGMPESRSSEMVRSTSPDSSTPSAAVDSSRTTSGVAQEAARATATAWRCPPDNVSTGWEVFWMVAIPSASTSSVAGWRMPLVSSIRNTEPSTPGRRCSRPRNTLLAMSRAGATANVR